MSKLRFWLCLFILVCLRIHHTQGWFWYDDSKENEKGAQTPAYLTTVRATTPPRTEPSKTTGTSASVTEVSYDGGHTKGESEFKSRSGLRVESESKSGSWSEFASGSGSGYSQFERQDGNVKSTNVLRIAGEDARLHVGKFQLETKEEQMDGLQSNSDPTDSPFNESMNVSSKNISIYDGSNSTEHDGYDNTTLYSSEYSVSDNLLTIESEFLVASMPTTDESPRCLPVDSKLPFCTKMGVESFKVPNFLNQSTVEEVQVVLTQWAWLLRSNCHHSLEWFFCLLLTPRCGPPGQPPPLPCRSFCEVLRDSCWMLLDEGRLPVECHSLPEEKHDGYRCLSVSNQKGNGRLECHLFCS
ncbi:uncharacterized protein [Garra rufa]|uniref:uncharacterized protein n=1 Tax=Garra rufa TaxID=137080 RepID=UPI003CCE56E2